MYVVYICVSKQKCDDDDASFVKFARLSDDTRQPRQHAAANQHAAADHTAQQDSSVPVHRRCDEHRSWSGSSTHSHANRLRSRAHNFTSPRHSATEYRYPHCWNFQTQWDMHAESSGRGAHHFVAAADDWHHYPHSHNHNSSVLPVRAKVDERRCFERVPPYPDTAPMNTLQSSAVPLNYSMNFGWHSEWSGWRNGQLRSGHGKNRMK